MKPQSHFIAIALTGAIVAVAAPAALAQRANNTATSATATSPSAGPWTASNVMAARPFGNIDTVSAGTTNQTVHSWVLERSPSQRAELNGRCNIIGNPYYTRRYPAQAQQFCQNYLTVESAYGYGTTTIR